MPNWRQNLLSAGESLLLGENAKKSDTPFHNSNSLSRIISPVTVVPSDVYQSKSNTGSRKPSKNPIADPPQIIVTNNTLQYGSEKKFGFGDGNKTSFFCRESNLSADFSSFLTDSSSFADYEDRRGSVSNLEDPPKVDIIEHEQVVEKIALSQNVFCMPTHYQQKPSNIFAIEDFTDGSDCVSTSTCDSFERCEFDCREFEPFSDTCCCDPNSDGGCARSPKLLDLLGEDHCISPSYREEDGISTRSDMDGLDLTLFEPAQRCQQSGTESSCLMDGPLGRNFEQNTNVVVGLLYLMEDQSGKKAGHCVVESGSAVIPERLKLTLGKVNYLGGDYGTQEKRVFEVVPHPDFSSSTLENDIAIIKLATEVKFSEFVQPICLPDTDTLGRDSLFGKYGFIVGWGATRTAKFSYHLRQALLPVRSDLECVKNNPTFFGNFLRDNTFCAGYTNGTAACNGDSGGGFFMMRDNVWHLRGIISLGVSQAYQNMCDPDYYTIFTDVTKHLDFITATGGLNF